MRLTALWWWIDRWRKSSAYMDMTLEEQGAYRNLLDEAHLRGGPLPTDERVLAKACGDALAWPRVKANVLARFELRDDGWHNGTLDEVYQKTRDVQAARAEAGRLGGLSTAKHAAKGQANAQQTDNQTPLAKTFPPVPVPVPVPKSGSGSEKKSSGVNSRSKRPIFSGQRFVVFDWMLEDMTRTLGQHSDGFDFHEWFFALDADAVKSNQVLSRQDVWPWLQRKLLDEARKRGLPMASFNEVSDQTRQNLAAMDGAVARIKAGAHR